MMYKITANTDKTVTIAKNNDYGIYDEILILRWDGRDDLRQDLSIIVKKINDYKKLPEEKRTEEKTYEILKVEEEKDRLINYLIETLPIYRRLQTVEITKIEETTNNQERKK